MNKPHPAQAIPVWDRFVRVFHLSLVSCVLVNFFVIDDGKTLHQWLGYAASTLVVARSDFLRCEGCLVDWFTRLSETKDLNQVWVA